MDMFKIDTKLSKARAFKVLGTAALALALAAPLACNDEDASTSSSAAAPDQPLGVPSTAPDGEAVSDSEIARAVRSELLFDPSVRANLIDVRVADGIVTLEGAVDNLRGKQNAVRSARAIKGVRSVIDRVKISGAARPCSEVQGDVKAALAADPVAQKKGIRVSCTAGVVTLSGTVASQQERRLVSEVAKGVRGVLAISDKLETKYPKQPSDDQIERDIRARLRRDVHVDEGLIKVEVGSGKVTLSGVVGSAAEKANAGFDAWVLGTKHVKNDLDVRYWARDLLRRKRTPLLSDAAIAKAVRDAFLFDPRVLSFNPAVTVDNGVVTLTGAVDSLGAKIAAERDAENTVGVLRVNNELTVRPPFAFDDAVLSASVESALERDVTLHRYGLSASADSGVITLSGTVPTRFDKQLAASIASRIAGVTALVNNIFVNPPLRLIADIELKARIRDELRWSPWLDEKDIGVTVIKGVATLSGTVDNAAERRIAALRARLAGAKVVINNIEIEPSS